MAKELIISANVYEKKVALIEDGVVTEFYVERRDENQGVVGNLYKGRVMKVLPGMQSAFVDIGLERDAFLYVSDFTEFMEDEEEVDFKEVSESAQRQAEDRGKRDRRDREPAAPKPVRKEEEKIEPIEGAVVADVIEQLAEIADERILPVPQPEEELEAAMTAEAAASGDIREATVTVPSYVRVGDLEATPGPVFERVADDDFSPIVEDEASIPLVSEEPGDEMEAAVSEGEQPVRDEVTEPEKPKRSRSRKKAAEAEPEPKPSRRAKKPAAADTKGKTSEPAGASAKKTEKTAKPSAKRPSRKSKSESQEESPAQQFERIVDEFAGGVQEEKKPARHKAEPKEAAVAEKPAFQPEPEPEWRVGSFRSQTGTDSGFQRVADESGEERTKEEEAGQTRSAAAEADAAFPIPSTSIQEESSSHFSHQQISEPAESNDDRETSFAYESTDEPMRTEDDGEASVRDYNHREEFAVRRGGRGRRRPPRRDQKGAAASAPIASEESGEEEPGSAKTEVQAEKPENRQGDYRRSEKPESRQGDFRRSEQPQPRRERGGPPTISDLLREGQEVLVQIAKEPIAKKGARITSHIALPGRFLVYMPTVNHVGVSRKIPSDAERIRLKRLVASLRDREGAPGGFIARTACAGTTEQELHDDMRYLIRTWNDIRKKADRAKPPSLVHRDLDLIQRILRDQLADDFNVIRVDNEIEYARIVEFVNRVQPRLVNRVKLYTGGQPILEKYNVQPEIDKAVKPRVWLKSGGYIVINQTEALVAIDVNTGKFVGKSDKLEDTITKTNLEAAKELVRQIRLRDLGGIIIVDFIDMEERKNRIRVTQTLQEALAQDRSPSKILSINDFGLLAITRKRVKQSLERTLCAPCPYCQGGGMVKSAQTMCFEILEQAKSISPQVAGASDVLLRVSPVVAEALHTTERAVFEEVEAYFGTPVTIEADYNLHQEQFDFAIA